jgi:hypothetical protein
MARYVRKLALLAKIEASYGTDAVPTGMANAILATNVTLTPMAGGEESRDLLLPWLGHQGVILTGQHVQLEFSVECAGAGAAGDVPGYGPLLRACGLSETVDDGVSVVYQPVSAAFEAATIYYNLDGVRHIALGCRGNVTLEMTPQRIPRWRFRLLGLLGTITDTVLPSVDHSAFVTPKEVSKANTTLALHGYTGPVEAFTFDLGMQVEPRMLINHESIEEVDRRSVGSVTVQAASLATKNWFTIAQDRTRDVVAVQHGTVAGNIVKIDAAKAEIGRPTQGSSQGIANYQLGLMLCPDAGNDEVAITVR